MPYFIFIVIAHVYHNGTRLLNQFIHLCGIYIPALTLHGEGFIGNAIRYNLITHFYLQYPERSAVIIYGNIQPDAVQRLNRIEVSFECFKATFRYADLCINAFLSYIDAPEYFQRIQLLIQ